MSIRESAKKAGSPSVPLMLGLNTSASSGLFPDDLFRRKWYIAAVAAAAAACHSPLAAVDAAAAASGSLSLPDVDTEKV